LVEEAKDREWMEYKMNSPSDFIDSLRLSIPNRKVNNSKEQRCECQFNKVA